MQINVKLDDLVIECNNVYNAIKMKPAGVKARMHIDFNVENNEKDLKFEAGDHVKIWKCKNILGKAYLPNYSEEVFVIKKVKNTVLWTYVISDLQRVKKLLECFM